MESEIIGKPAFAYVKVTLAPGESAMWTIPLCGLAELGAAWTVVVELDGTDVSVGTGRTWHEAAH